MLELQLPWWEFIVRGTIMFFALFMLVRFSGKRTVGQFTPFDLIVVMLLSESVTASLTGGDESLAGGLIVALTLVTLNGLVAYAGSRSRKLDNILQGEPVMVGRDGVIYEQVLRREKVGRNDVEQALRENDCALEDMRMAVLEADGKISILKRER